MDRNKVIAEAIRAVLNEKQWSVDAVEGSIPRGFWHDVSTHMPSGLPFPSTHTDISNYLGKKGGQNKVLVFDILKSLSVDNVHYAHSESESAYPSESTHQKSFLTEADVRLIVSEELTKRKIEVNEVIHNGHTKLSPEPPSVTGKGKGRRYQRKYVKVSITIDEELWTLFQHEQRKVQTTAPRLMDSILWSHFGHPKLSFEKDK